MNSTCPDTQSARSCGCDPGANHVCERHEQEGQVGWEFMSSPYVKNGVFDFPTDYVVNPDPTPVRAVSLPTDAAARKTYPIGTGVLDYFPDALAAVAHTSWVGNEQHNPGQPLHWAREKSTDEADALIRHFLQRGQMDSDGVRHSAKVAWRALALLQKEIESELGRPESTKLCGLRGVWRDGRDAIGVDERNTDFKNVCRDSDPDSSFVCTRSKEHVGDHVAHYHTGLVCARWAQEAK